MWGAEPEPGPARQPDHCAEVRALARGGSRRPWPEDRATEDTGAPSPSPNGKQGRRVSLPLTRSPSKPQRRKARGQGMSARCPLRLQRKSADGGPNRRPLCPALCCAPWGGCGRPLGVKCGGSSSAGSPSTRPRPGLPHESRGQCAEGRRGAGQARTHAQVSAPIRPLWHPGSWTS